MERAPNILAMKQIRVLGCSGVPQVPETIRRHVRTARIQSTQRVPGRSRCQAHYPSGPCLWAMPSFMAAMPFSANDSLSP